MEIKFDTYSLKARVFPIYLTLVPLVLLLSTVVPEGLKILIGGGAALVFVPISFLLSQIGGDFGKRLEKDLWKKWGGSPTTRFLRHGNHEFNEVTRNRIHEKLRLIGLHVPTQDEQLLDPRSADTHYQSCTEELIRRTRNIRMYPLVFKELTNYGFRRNLLGLKSFGVSLTVFGLIGSVWSLIIAWAAANELPTISLITSFINFVLFLIWLFWVTKPTVKMSDDRYARFLLEAALDLE